MDKKAILKLFEDKAKQGVSAHSEPCQIINNGQITIHQAACLVEDNNNLNAEDKQSVRDLVATLEAKNKQR